MKILKYLFFLILIGLIAGSIYIATKDGNYQIEESTTINAPLPVVFNEVNNFKNWEEWGPWMDDTEDLILAFSDTTSGEGASYSWKSEKIGDGSITTTKAIPDSTIEQELTIVSKYGETKSDVYWKFDKVEEGTKVTWGIQGRQSFMEKLAFAFTDSSYTQMMRPMIAEGLEKLKLVTMDKMESYSINVDGVTQFGGGFYMYTTTASKISQIQLKMRDMFTEVSRYMENNNISIQGDPFVIYNDWDEQNNNAIYSAGRFTPSLVITPAESPVLNGMMPVQKVVKTSLKGDYKNLKEAWDEAYNYLEKNNLQATPDSHPFEVYKTNPEITLNPAKWITEIYIPVSDKQELIIDNPELKIE
ncbi:MAG: effector binding domain-containing protein [Flavobacteriaceae bacterium]|nr:effector binding domain-containing protein [Flavobacteriaceae bacterium]